MCAFKIAVGTILCSINALKTHYNKAIVKVRKTGRGTGDRCEIDDHEKSKEVKMKARLGGVK